MSIDSGPMAYFQARLREGRFVLQKARGSGKYVFYPRVSEPGTGDTDLEWVPATGKGQVYSCTTVYPRKQEPYNISIIQLDEGPRLMSRVVGVDPDKVFIGMEVYALIDSAPNADVAEPVLLFSAHPQSGSGGALS